MKLSIPSISFFQDASVHHPYASDRTISVHSNAEPLTTVVRSLFSQQYSCWAMLLRGFLEPPPDRALCYSTVLLVLGRRQHLLRQNFAGTQDEACARGLSPEGQNQMTECSSLWLPTMRCLFQPVVPLWHAGR